MHEKVKEIKQISFNRDELDKTFASIFMAGYRTALKSASDEYVKNVAEMTGKKLADKIISDTLVSMEAKEAEKEAETAANEAASSVSEPAVEDVTELPKEIPTETKEDVQQ